MTSICMANGIWVPIPQTDECILAGTLILNTCITVLTLWQNIVPLDCGNLSVSSGVVIESFNSTMFNATIIFHCEEGLIPDTVVEAVCGSTGVWSPHPANHFCANLSLGKKRCKLSPYNN